MVKLMLVAFGLAGLIVAAGWLSIAYLIIPGFFRLLVNISIRLGRRWG